MDRTQLIDRYIEMWNETDSERRRALVHGIWTEGATYRDPMMRGEGPAGIDAMVAGVQARFPGHRFRRLGNVECHNDRLRFAWELGPDDGPAIVKGTDFGIVGEGGRLQEITGFFDHVAQQ